MDRLTRDQLEQLFKKVRPVKTSHLSCRMIPVNLRGWQPTGLATAVVVGKTVSNKATVRNRLRRQVKGALQALERKEKLTGQLAVVVRERFELPFDELVKELRQCFRR